jgi:hypothetical protein
MKQDVHYIAGIPRKPLPDGIVLVHNHVIPQRRLGLNGFRAWTQTLDESIEPCPCNWAGGRPHYRLPRVRRAPEVAGGGSGVLYDDELSAVWRAFLGPLAPMALVQFDVAKKDGAPMLPRFRSAPLSCQRPRRVTGRPPLGEKAMTPAPR